MTQVTLTRNAGGRKAGETITTTPGSADKLINSGYAEAVETPKSSPDKGSKGQDKAEKGATSPPVGDASPAEVQLPAG